MFGCCEMTLNKQVLAARNSYCLGLEKTAKKFILPVSAGKEQGKFQNPHSK